MSRVVGMWKRILEASIRLVGKEKYQRADKDDEVVKGIIADAVDASWTQKAGKQDFLLVFQSFLAECLDVCQTAGEKFGALRDCKLMFVHHHRETDWSV
eukprot:404877-Hanusia_phi.AAC.1